MRIGVPREVKPGEGRVALTPTGADLLTRDGHVVVVEAGAGAGGGYRDRDYVDAGATVVSQDEVWDSADLLVKVKEPIGEEYARLRPGLALFTYLHLAPNRPLTDALLSSGATAIAYETVQDDSGALPLLAPMSEIAGRLAAQAGAFFLQEPAGGPGLLIGGAPGVAPANVLILGGGVAGAEAARVAAGMGAQVTVLELSLPRIRQLEAQLSGRTRILMSDPATLQEEAARADLVIGAVLIPGTRAPRLITRELLRTMRPRTVLVDIAVDQGGCAETTRPTTHADPTFLAEGILHYCVANMPGAVPQTATRALTNATLPYVRRLADLGVDRAITEDPGLALGLSISGGSCARCGDRGGARADRRRSEDRRRSAPRSGAAGCTACCGE